jgi:hypothetical protein
MQPTIPKRIIQTGKHARPSLAHRAAIANLTLLNPDFEHVYFDNPAVETFFEREFPQYSGIFRSFRFPIQRYDFFRYLAVYRYGGFYFDLDVFLASSLSTLLDSGCVFPFEGLTFSRFLRDRHEMDWQIGNYAFGAAAGHPFLQAVIENCVRAQNDASWVEPMMKGMPPLSRDQFLVLNTTGPGLLSRTFAEHPALAETVTVLLPEDVCDMQSWNRFGEFGIHMMDGSWRGDAGGFLRRRLALHWEDWTMRRLLRESERLGKTRVCPGDRRSIPPADDLRR